MKRTLSMCVVSIVVLIVLIATWTMAVGEELLDIFSMGEARIDIIEDTSIEDTSIEAVGEIEIDLTLDELEQGSFNDAFNSPSNDSKNDDFFIASNDNDFEVDDYDSIEDHSISRTYPLGQIIEVYWENSKHRAKSWSSSNTKVVQVKTSEPDASCYMYMKSVGKATVSIKMDNGKKLYIYIKVVDPYAPTYVEIVDEESDDMFVTGKTYNVLVGNTVQLSSISFLGSEYVNIRQDVTWKSSKESVADVDSTGLVYCKREGSAKITVTTYNGKKASCTFKVKQNKADNLCPKPKTKQIKNLGNRYVLALKSIEKKKYGDVVCEAYFANGTTQKIKYLTNVELLIYNKSGEVVCGQYFSKIKVDCKKYSYTKVKLTYEAEYVNSNFDPYRDGKDLNIQIEIVDESQYYD